MSDFSSTSESILVDDKIHEFREFVIGVANTDALEESVAVGANPLAAGTVKTATSSNANTIGTDILKPRRKLLSTLILLRCLCKKYRRVISVFRMRIFVEYEADCIQFEMIMICKAFVSPFFLSF